MLINAVFPTARLAMLSQTEPSWFSLPSPVLLFQVASSKLFFDPSFLFMIIADLVVFMFMYVYWKRFVLQAESLLFVLERAISKLAERCPSPWQRPPAFPDAIASHTVIPPMWSGSAPGVPPNWICKEYLYQLVAQRNPNQKLNWLLSMQRKSVSPLSSFQTPELYKIKK